MLGETAGATSLRSTVPACVGGKGTSSCPSAPTLPKPWHLPVRPSLESGKRLQPSRAISLPCYHIAPDRLLPKQPSPKNNNTTSSGPVVLHHHHHNPHFDSHSSAHSPYQINRLQDGDRSKSSPHQFPQYPGCFLALPSPLPLLGFSGQRTRSLDATVLSYV